jgi:hypothetical protein
LAELASLSFHALTGGTRCLPSQAGRLFSLTTMPAKKRLLLIGWDSADWKIMAVGWNSLANRRSKRFLSPR